MLLTLSQIILIFENEDWKKTTCYLLHREKKEQDICSEGVADGEGRAGSKYDEGAMNVALFQPFFYALRSMNENLQWLHCTWNPIYVFPEMKLWGLVSNSYIHVSVSDLYIPRIGMPIRVQRF